jgi:cytochrome P450
MIMSEVERAALPHGPEMAMEDLFQIFVSNPFPFLKDCHEKYGDMFTLPMGNFGVDEYGASGSWVIVSDPEHLKQLYKAKPEVFLAGAANDIQFMRMMPKQGSVILDGPEHKERRDILRPLLTGRKIIESFTGIIVSVTKRELAKHADGQTFELAECFQRITGEIMRFLNFGEAVNSNTDLIAEKLREFGVPELTPPEKRAIVEDCQRVVGDIYDDYAKCLHAKQVYQNSAIQTLVEGNEDQPKLTEIQFLSELVVLLVAGTDTTATTLTWMMAWMFSDRDVLEKVLNEIASVFGDKEPQAEDFKQLTYLDAVIWESCRRSPMIFTTSARLLRDTLNIGEYQLPAGTMVVNSPYLTHTDAANYADPFVFDPKRFLTDKPDPFKMLHFGGGVRRCIGVDFALYEMKVIAATMLHQTRFKTVEISTEPEMRGGFFAPKGGVKVAIQTS